MLACQVVAASEVYNGVWHYGTYALDWHKDHSCGSPKIPATPESGEEHPLIALAPDAEGIRDG